MREEFREYHQFTDEGYADLLSRGLFVLDTNTLLNMYRYSRGTVDNYLEVLNKLKKTDQIWIPYQVGFEFHENRIDVINDYEKSYDDITAILNKAKHDLDSKYRDHPFLNMAELKKEIETNLSKVEDKISKAKEQHPKWLQKDDVLSKIADLYEGCTGKNYSLATLEKMYEEGKERYALKIPPGFRDEDKPEPRKYGDLIVWNQMIDKAKESRKPIIFISGDVKDDWWLKKDGKRIMPLPQLKKEMLDKADVDFHIYTADKFLELFKKGDSDIEEKTIDEVRKVLEVEEQKMIFMNELNEIETEKNLIAYRESKYAQNDDTLEDFAHIFRQITHLKRIVQSSNINSDFLERPEFLFEKISALQHDLEVHGNQRGLLRRLARYLRELSIVLRLMVEKAEPSLELRVRLNTHATRLNIHRNSLMRHLDSTLEI